MLKHSEHRAHTVALFIAILGPLINLLIGLNYATAPPGMYLYWIICLSLYIIILIPFTYKSPLTFIKLIFLGIMIEDFSSHLWRSLFFGSKFLPICNWYTQHFPLLGNWGEPTPIVLIPRWYFLAALFYTFISVLQYRKEIEIFFKKRKKPLRKGI